MTPLPSKIRSSAYRDDWAAYSSALLSVFEADFMIPPYAVFQAMPVYIDVRPEFQGLPKRLWHSISSGKTPNTPEHERVIDYRRCEHLPWARPLIERAEVRLTPCWVRQKGRRFEAYIACDDFSYVVILKRQLKDACWYLATTFCPNRSKRAKFRQEWEASAPN